MKKLLTEKFIKTGLVCPKGQPKIEFCDTLIKGFRIDVTAISPGRGTYYKSQTEDGKRSHLKIGTTESISLKKVREIAKNLDAEYQLGNNPYAAAKAKKAIMTWSCYMQTIYLPHVRAHLRSYKNLESINEKYLEPEIGDLALNRISLQKTQTLHRDMVDVHGLSPASADHGAKMLRQALLYAVRLDLLASTPVSKIQLFNVDNREERLMSPEDLQALVAALDSAGDRQKTVCLVVKFLLLTGCRVSESLHAKWNDIDRKNRTWTIQATNSKSKKRRSVPLSDAALEVLDQLDTEGKSEWLFTNSRNGERLQSISKTWQVLRLKAGLKNLRLHDLRHMHASMLINSGQSLYVVQQILGHSDPSVTQRYAHLSTESLQQAANSVGAYLEKALEEKS